MQLQNHFLLTVQSFSLASRSVGTLIDKDMLVKLYTSFFMLARCLEKWLELLLSSNCPQTKLLSQQMLEKWV